MVRGLQATRRVCQDRLRMVGGALSLVRRRMQLLQVSLAGLLFRAARRIAADSAERGRTRLSPFAELTEGSHAAPRGSRANPRREAVS